MQEQSYYPFGTEMHGISSKAFGKLESQYKFNGGVELEESIEMYTTFYRQYDQQLGRFNGIDILSEQNAIMSVYSFANNNPAIFNDPLGDMASSDNPNTVGDIIQHITNQLNFGFTKTDYMFDFGENNALVWDFTTLGKDGEAGISFGFNMTSGGGLNNRDQIISEIVRGYINAGKYNDALCKVITSYPNSFREIGGHTHEFTDETYHITETTYNLSLKKPFPNSFKSKWSKELFKQFARGEYSFGEFTRQIYHEFEHVYSTQGPNSGYPYFDHKSTNLENEVYAYYKMHQNDELPPATASEIANNYWQLFKSEGYSVPKGPYQALLTGYAAYMQLILQM